MIRDEDLGSEAIGMRLRAMTKPPAAPTAPKPGKAKGKPGSSDDVRRTARRNVETQLQRMYAKLNRPEIRGDGPTVRSRTGLLDRIWVEYWRMREEHQCTTASPAVEHGRTKAM